MIQCMSMIINPAHALNDKKLSPMTNSRFEKFQCWFKAVYEKHGYKLEISCIKKTLYYVDISRDIGELSTDMICSVSKMLAPDSGTLQGNENGVNLIFVIRVLG